MKIRNRLALYFTLISAIILFLGMIFILITFNSFVRADFYNRLTDRAKVAAQLYLEADEISADSLNHVRERYINKLPGEIIRFYNDKNAASFIKDKQQYWSSGIINQVRQNKQLSFTEGLLQTVGIYYKDNQGNFVILVTAEDLQGKKRLNDLIEIMSILLIAALGTLFIIGQWFAKKALEPLDEVVKEMQLVRADNLAMRIHEGNGKDEISMLAQNFNRLLSHLENAFELQRTFVTNASHELRTPVTSIVGEVEVALNKERTVDEYKQLLQSVLIDFERLNHTITGLLELAQVDMNLTEAATSMVAIDDLIWELHDYWTKKLRPDMLNVIIEQLPDDPDMLLVRANRALLFIALNNIISNAFKFSGDKQVKCFLYADEQLIRIRITDNGIGIPAEDMDKIFQSFYRGTNVKGFHGSGIGLYVTSKIISLFNGTIQINPQTPAGTAIIIEFTK